MCVLAMTAQPKGLSEYAWLHQVHLESCQPHLLTHSTALMEGHMPLLQDAGRVQRAAGERRWRTEPHPMRPEERRRLTWEDATERFLEVAELKPGERPKGWEEACDKLTWNAFNSISGAPALPGSRRA